MPDDQNPYDDRSLPDEGGAPHDSRSDSATGDPVRSYDDDHGYDDKTYPAEGPMSGYDDKTHSEPLPVAELTATRKPSPLPWILFAVTAVMATVVAMVLASRASSAADALAKADEARGVAEIRAKTVEDRLAASQVRTAELEGQAQKLTEERDALLAKVKALETAKAAGPEKASSKASSKTAAAKKAAAKKKASKTKRR